MVHLYPYDRRRRMQLSMRQRPSGGVLIVVCAVLAAASGCGGGSRGSGTGTTAGAPKADPVIVALQTARQAEIQASNYGVDPAATVTYLSQWADDAATWQAKVRSALASIPTSATGTIAEQARMRLTDLGTFFAAARKNAEAATWAGEAQCDESYFEARDRILRDDNDPGAGVDDLGTFAAWCDRTLFVFFSRAPEPAAAAGEVLALHDELHRYVAATLKSLGARNSDPDFALGRRVMAAGDTAVPLVRGCLTSEATCDQAKLAGALKGVELAFWAK
jgi:hypothetical protein